MKPDGYIEVVDWTEFQHYKDRDPPWIKLHRKVLDNYAWSRLQDASKAHLVGIWILAARHQNRIPADAEYIAARIGARTQVNLQVLMDAGFIRHASSALALRGQNAMPEAEAEAYTEEAEKNKRGKAADAARPADSPIGQILQAVRKHLYVPDGKPPEGWSDRRCASIAQRKLKAGTPVGEILDAIEGFALLRDRGEFEWIKPHEKATLRVLYHTHSGAVPVYTLALNALHERPRAPRDKSKPAALDGLVDTMLTRIAGAK